MTLYFLTHVQPVHLVKGTLARFFIREYNPESRSKTHIREKEIPYLMYTKPYEESQLAQKVDLLASDLRYQHLNITAHQKPGGGSYLRAQGSKEDKDNLPTIFQERHTQHRSPRSPSEQLRWLYPPGLVLASPDDIPEPTETNLRPRVSLEALLHDSYAVLDIEIEGWEQGKDQIFMVVYVSPANHAILHNLPFEDKIFNDFQLIRYQTQQDLGRLLTTIIETEDPLWLFGHNIMNFDNIKIRNLTKSYLPTPDSHYPVTKSAQGLGKVIARGRFTLDTYAYHFFHRNFYRDNKLETIGEFKKEIDYLEQAFLIDRAKEGDHASFATLVSYCSEDGLRTEKIAHRIKPIIALKAHHYQREPDSICATSKTALINDWWGRQYYYKNGLPPPKQKHDPNKPTISAPLIVNTSLYKDFKPGFHHQATIIAATPLLAAGHFLTSKRSGGLAEYYKLLTGSLEKLDAALTLQEEITPLIIALSNLLNSPSLLLHERLPARALHQANEIFQRHGLTDDPNRLIQNTFRVLNQMNSALRHAGVYNAGPTLYALERTIDSEALERKLYGVYLGEGQVLSLKPGVFVANPLHEKDPARFIYQGIRPTKGRKTNFEKRVLLKMVAHFFNKEPIIQIKQDLQEELAQFAAGKKEAQDYFISIKTRSFYRQEFREVLDYAVSSQENHSQTHHSGQTHTIHDQLANFLTKFKGLQHRIHDRFSVECKKELRAILKEGSSLFCYPYLLELHQGMEHPYPPTIDLLYPAGLHGQLRPILEGWSPDYEKYTVKAKETFKVFDTIFSRAKHGEQPWLL